MASKEQQPYQTSPHNGSGAMASNLEQALELLDKSITENKGEIQRRIQNEYHNIKSAFEEAAPHVTESVQRVGKQVMSSARDLGSEGYARTKEVASQVDRQVHENPWSYIAGTAAAGMLLGFFMGRAFYHET